MSGTSDTVQSVNVKSLRKGLQRFNEDLGQLINSDERYRLGRVLTVIDASIADPEQRKAIKDLIHNQWWNQDAKPSESAMANPHSDLIKLCEALGFDLYEDSNLVGERAASENKYNRYDEILGNAGSNR